MWRCAPPQAEMQPKDCGVLAVRADMADGIVTAELAAAHCAASMAFGYVGGGRPGSGKVGHVCARLPVGLASTLCGDAREPRKTLLMRLQG